MPSADTAIEPTHLERILNDGGIGNSREDRRTQHPERLEPHPIAAEKRDARRARVGPPPFADQAERLRHYLTDAMSSPARRVAIPRPVIERTAA